jgi:hypothetical protein
MAKEHYQWPTGTNMKVNLKTVYLMEMDIMFGHHIQE